MGSSTPEGRVKQLVNHQLRHFAAYYHMPVGNGMGAPGLDYHVNHRGIYAGIETKAAGKKPTDRQILTMIEVMNSGGSLFLIDGSDSLDFAALKGWLKDPQPGCIGPMARIAVNKYTEFKRTQRAETSDDGTDDRSGDIEHIHRSIGGGD